MAEICRLKPSSDSSVVANQNLIVDLFGCGCPTIDADGNTVTPVFNANDFTVCFWLFVSITVAVISAFASKRILKGKILPRIVYVAAICLVSLFLSYNLCRSMMWS